MGKKQDFKTMWNQLYGERKVKQFTVHVWSGGERLGYAIATFLEDEASYSVEEHWNKGLREVLPEILMALLLADTGAFAMSATVPASERIALMLSAITSMVMDDIDGAGGTDNDIPF